MIWKNWNGFYLNPLLHISYFQDFNNFFLAALLRLTICQRSVVSYPFSWTSIISLSFFFRSNISLSSFPALLPYPSPLLLSVAQTSAECQRKKLRCYFIPMASDHLLGNFYCDFLKQPPKIHKNCDTFIKLYLFRAPKFNTKHVDKVL